MIPTARALIGWNTNAEGRVVEVIVLDQGENPDLYDLGPPSWQRAGNTHGACFSDWLKQPDMTPEFVFSELLVAYGFADSDVAEKAIAAFSQIDGCDWARKMTPTVRMDRPSWRAVRAEPRSRRVPPRASD